LAGAGAEGPKVVWGKDLGQKEKQKNMKQGLDMGGKIGYNTLMKINNKIIVPSLREVYYQSIQDAQTGKISWDDISNILAREVKRALPHSVDASKIVCDSMLEMDLWE